jgi:hypothetical protein
MRKLMLNIKWHFKNKKFRKENLALFVNPQEYIPQGHSYCYGKNGTCLFWDEDKKTNNQESGYCHLLKNGDWNELSFLWDQVSSCEKDDDGWDF